MPGLTYDYPDYVFTGVDPMLTNPDEESPRLSRAYACAQVLDCGGFSSLLPHWISSSKTVATCRGCFCR